MTLSTKSLSERIAETAEAYVGQPWNSLCGALLREILAKNGVSVPGQLRTAGIEVMIEDRKPGNLILLYNTLDGFKENNPSWGLVLTRPNICIGTYGGEVKRIPIEFYWLNDLPSAKLHTYLNCLTEKAQFVMIRRIEGAAE